jgi:hypothetical protein
MLLLARHALEAVAIVLNHSGMLLVGGDKQFRERGVHVEQRGFERRLSVTVGRSGHSVHLF